MRRFSKRADDHLPPPPTDLLGRTSPTEGAEATSLGLVNSIGLKALNNRDETDNFGVFFHEEEGGYLKAWYEGPKSVILTFEL